MPLDHARLQELFLAACDLPEAEQRALIDDRCAGDSDLRDELERLLRNDAREDGLFADDKTTDGIEFRFDTAVTAAELPANIGRYRVRRVLGEGGMGVVYLAAQENPAREVAVKVIRAGLVSTDLLKRFQVEAALLGRLTHPGIARIYEAGTFVDNSSGQERPFLAMEYIDGQPLREFTKNSELETRDRLRLFVRICDAVQHAHQKGVIHRDLKPSNVVVQKNGQPSILDFGVARATEIDPDMPTLQTQAGQLIGTLSYMSPEQVTGNALDVDTRSDVYALGVMAYELLSGKLPHDVEGSDYLKAANAISHDPPLPLASTSPKFRGDLNTIVLKALEKDPLRRYQSASELADDVQRYLDGKPIVAVATSALGRLGKWCKRNKAVASLLGLLALAIVLGFVGITRQTFSALKSQQQSERVLDLMVQSFRSPDPAISGRDVKMADVLTKIAADLDGELDDEPLMKAKLLQAIGQSMQALAIHADAIRLHKMAFEIRKQELGEEHPDTIASMADLATAHYQANNQEESRRLNFRCLELSTKVLGEEHPDTIASMHRVAIGYDVSEKLDKAIELHEKAVELARRAQGQLRPSSLPNMINSLVIVYMKNGDHDLALPLAEEALQSAKTSLGERHPTTIESLGLYAWVYQTIRPVDETIPLHVEIMAIFQEVYGEEHPKTLKAMMYAAEAYFENDDKNEAIRLLEIVLPKFRAKFSDEHIFSIVSVNYLGWAYLLDDRPQEALELLKSLPAAVEDGWPEEGKCILAEAHLRAGDPEKGVALLNDVLESNRTELADDAPSLAEMLEQIATHYLDAERFAEAEPLLREALELTESMDANDWRKFSIQSALGASLSEQGQHDDAEPLLLAGVRGLLAERDEPPFPIPRLVANAIQRTIRFYQLTEKPDQVDSWQTVADGL